MYRIKSWLSFFLLEFTSIEAQGPGVSEPVGVLLVQLCVLVLRSAAGLRKGNPRL